jgi:peroxiredoxin Q/BCP
VHTHLATLPFWQSPCKKSGSSTREKNMATSKSIGPQEGDKAPDFTLPGDGGQTIRLKDFKGKTVVLYFYPKDDTSGCTREATEFTAALKDFKKAGAVVIGVSKDTPKKHDAFKAKHKLEVALASDEDGTMIEGFGSWVEKSLYGRKYMGIDRSTFVIDGKGVIRKIWRKVKVPGHVDAVLDMVNAL